LENGFAKNLAIDAKNHYMANAAKKNVESMSFY